MSIKSIKIATIIINKSTAGHAGTLARFGYSTRPAIRDGKEVLEVLATSYAKEVTIMKNKEEDAFRALAQQGTLCTYSTKFRFMNEAGSALDPAMHTKKDGTIVQAWFGVPACLKLKGLSAFVVSPLGDFDPQTGVTTVTKK